jgi:hypothetical protein
MMAHSLLGDPPTFSFNLNFPRNKRYHISGNSKKRYITVLFTLLFCYRSVKRIVEIPNKSGKRRDRSGNASTAIHQTYYLVYLDIFSQLNRTFKKKDVVDG